MTRTPIQHSLQHFDVDSQRGFSDKETPALETEQCLHTSLTLPARTSSLENPVLKGQYATDVDTESDTKRYAQVSPCIPVQFPWAFKTLPIDPISFQDCCPDVQHFMNVHTSSTGYVIDPLITHDDEEHRESDFQETRDWLAELCKEEQSKADWEPEYVLPAIENVPLEPAMDTEILESITMGLGPRPDEQKNQTRICKDIIAELRRPLKSPHTWYSEGGEEAGGGEARSIETYEELHAILQAWNRSVSVVENHDKKREDLLLALRERECMLDDIRYRSRSPEHLQKQSVHMLEALCACWPEIKEWEKAKEPYDTMVAIIANRRVAKPEIEDDEVWDAIFIVLLAELKMSLPEEWLEDEFYIQNVLKHPGAWEIEEVRKNLIQRDGEVFDKMAVQIATWLLDDLKAARKNLRQKVLGQLQYLAMQQVGMREHLNGVGVQTALEPWLQGCSVADTEASQIVIQNSEIWDAESEAVISTHKVMWNLTRSARTRLLEIRDLERERDPAEGQQITAERENDPRTARLMDRVVKDRNVMAGIPEILFGRLKVVDEALQAGLESKARLFRDYAEWLHQDGGLDDGRIWALGLEADEVDVEEIQEADSKILKPLDGEGAKDPGKPSAAGRRRCVTSAR